MNVKRWLVGMTLVLVACSASGRWGITVTPIDAFGSFNAITTNTGDEAGVPSCTVRAYDAFGNRIGYDVFELSYLEPGASLPWNGHVPVDELVDRYEGEC